MAKALVLKTSGYFTRAGSSPAPSARTEKGIKWQGQVLKEKKLLIQIDQLN